MKCVNLKYTQVKVTMTCYFRHLHKIFEKAGIKVNIENKQEIDKLIHSIFNVQYKNCSAVWMKMRLSNDERDMVLRLKEAWSKQTV